MGIILDILKDIPLPAPIKEKLLNAEMEIEKVNVILQKVEKGEDIHKYVCSKCKQPKIIFINTRDKFYLGQFGDKIEHYKCEKCDYEYDIDIPVHPRKPHFPKF